MCINVEQYLVRPSPPASAMDQVVPEDTVDLQIDGCWYPGVVAKKDEEGLWVLRSGKNMPMIDAWMLPISGGLIVLLLRQVHWDSSMCPICH